MEFITDRDKEMFYVRPLGQKSMEVVSEGFPQS
jgi:hypothetical protein